VVACSSDEEYAQAVPEIHKALSKQAVVTVAGEPACKEDLMAGRHHSLYWCTQQSAGNTPSLSKRTGIMKTHYTAADLEHMEHLNYAAGISPLT